MDETNQFKFRKGTKVVKKKEIYSYIMRRDLIAKLQLLSQCQTLLQAHFLKCKSFGKEILYHSNLIQYLILNSENNIAEKDGKQQIYGMSI
ncbi:MAG: hypothetical protein EZS28_043419 [Streblomastix strix]|uniref:Uncharacterized protein n=1 Tax=Streblomastix strix TaxID=222440 RepID=A0A5J4TT24_9EUKA|nr:MAG: hypothetical protein EZS28_043419 [Streblomastix strix]